MTGGFEHDPHPQDGHACPRNFFGVTDYRDLKDKEEFYVTQRALQLQFKKPIGKSDTDHLRNIHRYLFQNLFPWAGEIRVTGLAKVGGAPFANPQSIAQSLSTLFAELHAEKLLKGLTREAFSRRGAYYWGELNAIHPFREGNGRAQREFLRQLAKQVGHKLSWADLQQEENTVASVLAHTRKDYSGLEKLLLANLRVTAEEKA